MAVNCSTQALGAIFKIEQLGKKAIVEAIEGSQIKNPKTKRQLQEDLELYLTEYVENLKAQLTDENLINEGILETLSLANQRMVFNMVERVRTVRNTIKTIDLVAKTSTEKRAVPGILRNTVSIMENPMKEIEQRISAIEDRVFAETIEGGTTKNPDMVEKSKLEYLDMKSGGRMTYDRLLAKGYSDPNFIMWKAVKQGHFKGDEILNIIAANVKKIKNEKDVILKSEYPNYEIPSQDFNYRFSKNKVYHKEAFIEFMSTSIEPHTFLGISKEQYDAMGILGFEKFNKGVEQLQKDIVEAGIDPINFGKRSKGKNPFNPSNIKPLDDALEYQMILKFGDIQEGIVASQVSFYKFQAKRAAEKSVMSDRPGLQFVAIRDYLAEKFPDADLDFINENVEQMVNYWQGTFHPASTVDETFSLIELGISHTVNSFLLGFVNGRNIAIDNTFFKAVIQHVQQELNRPTSAIKSMLSLLGANAIGMGKGAYSVFVKRKYPGTSERKLLRDTELMAEAAENAGIVISVSQPDMVMGSLRRSGDRDPILAKQSADTKGRSAARWFARKASGTADFISVMTGADATNKMARIDATVTVNGLIQRFFREQDWNKLSDKDRLNMERFGFTKEYFDIMKNVKRNKNGFVDYKEFQKLDVSSILDEFTSPAQARTHVRNMYNAMRDGLIEENAPLPGLKGEMSITKDRSGLAGLVNRLVFKYANINLTSMQALMKNAYIFTGLDPNLVANTKNPLLPFVFALELIKKNPKYAGETFLFLSLGGIFAIWASQFKNNEPLQAINPDLVAHGLAKTPAFGLVTEMLQGLYWGDGLIGDVTKPVVQSVTNIGRVGKSTYENKNKKALQNFLRAKQTFPITNMWWLNVGIDKAIRNGMDVPYTRYQKKRFRERGQLKDQFE